MFDTRVARPLNRSPLIVPQTSGEELWNPVTPGLPSAGFKTVQGRFRLLGDPGIEYRPAVQTSTNGIDWTGSAVALTATWYTTALPNIVALGSTSPTTAGITESLYYRFGFLTRRTAASTAVLSADIEWDFTSASKRATRLVLPTTLVSSNMQTSSGNAWYIPVSKPMPVGDISEVRGTLEIITTSRLYIPPDPPTAGYVQSEPLVSLAYDLLTSGADWQSTPPTGTALPGCSFASETGFSYGTWSSIAPGNNSFIRFGYLIYSGGTSPLIDFARVTGLVEFR